ncbi:hypothetical protein [Nitrosomonas communis]|uniref:hypothetical protein n=1 Tax=Nitrosomonas communis TaxID=44574 RepID=UPI003D2AAAF0
MKDELVALHNELCACRIKTSVLANMICKLESVNQNLMLEIRTLTEEIERFHNANPHGHRCKHCGSMKLKRTGGKPHKLFWDMDIVDIFFICLECEKESVFTIDTLE